MAATLGFDELNKPEFDSEAYIKQYFKPMRISEERKEEREEAAHSFLDVLLFILTLISMENEFNALDWAYIEAHLREELNRAALEYARASQALDDYIAQKAEDFIRITKNNDLDDPYWTSEERATKEAVNESNTVISMEEWQQAVDAGAVKKRWRTQKDELVRASHREVNGVEVEINRFFHLRKGILRFAGDEYYCKEESINCRCGTEFLDKDGKVIKIFWTKRGAEVVSTYSFDRAKSVTSVEDLNSISKSVIIEKESKEDIFQYFKTQYNVDVTGFENIDDLFKIKATFSGLDDLLVEFPEAIKKLHYVDYNQYYKKYGNFDSVEGRITFGPKGLQSYPTGYHEGSHVMEYVRKPVGTSYAYGILERARKNLGYRVRSVKPIGKYSFIEMENQPIGKYKDQVLLIVGDVKDLDNPREIFAYSMEMARVGTDNELANELYRLVKEDAR